MIPWQAVFLAGFVVYGAVVVTCAVAAGRVIRAGTKHLDDIPEAER